MRFIPLSLEGAYIIELSPKTDERGSFTRTFCASEFSKHGLKETFIQSNQSASKHKGTLRGLHYQLSPKAEIKLVRCVKGAFYDVLLDLREHSPTFGKSYGEILSADNGKMLYVPEGFAHGFLTLEPDSEALYLVSEYYSKELERGIRWDDPYFNIAWPAPPLVISEKDRHHPDFDPAYHLKSCTPCHPL